MGPTNPLLIGQIALERKYITPEHLGECLDLQASQPDAPRIGRILVSRGYLTEDRLAELIDEQQRRLRKQAGYDGSRRKDCLIGWRLIRSRRFTPQVVNEALRAQQDLAERGVIKKLGDVLVDAGRVTRDALEAMLCASRKKATSYGRTRSRNSGQKKKT